jgi:hypothetical protein
MTQTTDDERKTDSLTPLLTTKARAARMLGMSERNFDYLRRRLGLQLVRFGPRCVRVPLELVERLAREGAPSAGGDAT